MTMTAEEFRKKFNLEYNEDHAKASGSAISRASGGDGWGDESTGALYSEAGEYLGTAQAQEGEDGESNWAHYSNIGDAATPIKQEAEGKGFTNFESFSDLAGAAHWLTKGAEKEEVEEEPEEVVPLGKTASKALAGKEAFEDYQRSGDYVKSLMGDTGARNTFTENYKLNLKKRLEPGNELGVDDLNLKGTKGMSTMANKVVNKGAGFGPV